MTLVHRAKSTADQRLWRYMDLGKFIVMLAQQNLWFAKAAEFKDDPHEGFCFVEHDEIPDGTRDADWLRSSIAAESAAALKDAPTSLFVNCWSLGPESNLMWQAYSSNARSSVAVVSSTHRYVDAVDWANLQQRDFDCGPVVYYSRSEERQYLLQDLRHEPIPIGDGLIRRMVQLGFHKREFFKGENEWRAVVYQDPGVARGVTTQVDLDRLIEEIWVHPQADSYFLEAVHVVVDKFCLRKRIERSEISLGPSTRPAHS